MILESICQINLECRATVLWLALTLFLMIRDGGSSGSNIVANLLLATRVDPTNALEEGFVEQLGLQFELKHNVQLAVALL